MALAWVRKKLTLPKNNPSFPAELTALVANTPVINIPTIPPIPWQGNTSSVSSSFVDFCFIKTATLETTAAKTPIKMLWGIATKPAAGVMATRPTTAPIQKPITDGFLPRNTSNNIQDNPADAAAVFVVANAETDKALAAPAEPALKPNQPNQSKPVPIKT